MVVPNPSENAQHSIATKAIGVESYTRIPQGHFDISKCDADMRLIAPEVLPLPNVEVFDSCFRQPLGRNPGGYLRTCYLTLTDNVMGRVGSVRR